MQDLFREEIVEGQKDYEPLPIGECNEEIMSNFVEIIPQLRELPIQDLIETLNAIKRELHKISPFKMEPVDCVEWVRNDTVIANDYNPNSVAPTEMKLLAHSIGEDGYTQPIVSWMNALKREVVDGFHRHLVGKSSKSIRARVHGYLPVTTINDGRLDKGDRMAATIRHNRARGKHRIDSMSEIVIELKRRNWSDEKIGKELGMEPDEVLRLAQITGLAEIFKDKDFSEAWEAESFIDTAETLEESAVEENLPPLREA